MSDTWLGPGWWMAEDGLWYPPRPAKNMAISDEANEAGRWSRRSMDEEEPPSLLSSGDRIVRAARDPRAEDSVVDLRSNESEVVELDRELSVDSVKIDVESAVDAQVMDLDAIDEEVAEEAAAEQELLVSSVPLTDPTAITMAGSAAPELDVPTPVVRPDDGRSKLEFEDRKQENVDSPPTPEDRTISIEHAVAPDIGENVVGSFASRSPRLTVLLAVATLLAIIAGLLGAMWVRERSTTADLRAELAGATRAEVQPDNSAEMADLTDQLRTAEAENERLALQVLELQAIVPPVQEGRVSTIPTPLDEPLAFVGEVPGRFIAVAENGQYVVWGGGVDDEITDTGQLTGEPIGLVALRDASWVPTTEGVVELISMTGDEDPDPYVTGELAELTRSSRSMWGFSLVSGELQRYRQTNGRLLTAVDLPSPARSLTAGAGAVWVLGEDGIVYRVNTADFTVAPLSAGQEVISIAAGADALWSLSAADGSLRRLDAVSGEVLVTVPVGRDPVDAVVSGNSVWVALRAGSTLVEVDTRTSAVVSRTTLPGPPMKLTRGETGVLVTMTGDTPLVRVASVVPDVADAENDGAEDSAEG